MHVKQTLKAITLAVLMITAEASHASITLPDTTKIKGDVNNALNTITPAQKSALDIKWKEQSQGANNTLTITLYRPTYILPYYYTANPYDSVYQNNTPNDQRVKNSEFKAQLSFFVPVMTHIFNDPNKTLNIAYTQLNYWQFYTSSQYFRETNYEPEVFLAWHFHPNWLGKISVDHQSNGRGGDLERSWNRLIESVQLSGENWLIGANVWQLIFQGGSSDIHNPDIAHYLGYDNVLFTYKWKEIRASLQLQNLESALKRGSVTFTLSYPITKHLSLYGQLFDGYGQSLIEYNHHTKSGGIGLAFNDWI